MARGYGSRARRGAPRFIVAMTLLSFAASAAAAAPATGRYAATLCVSNAAQAPSCGPAELDVRPDGHVHVQVSDIVYRLRIKAGPAEVVVTQGTMQIDEFDTVAEWDGSSLRFADDERRLRYEVQIGAPKRSSN